jgi:shikimate kinase
MAPLKRIFIVGHMGAFKSALGKGLAEKLGWQYIDANPSLERLIGRSLHEILGEQGEAAFHACEAQIISEYINKEHVVIVLEEAVLATQNNRSLLSSECVVYSKISIPVQMERMLNGPQPLLPISDLKAFVNKLHLERDKFFEEVATITIEPTFSLEDDVNKIMKAIATV